MKLYKLALITLMFSYLSIGCVGPLLSHNTGRSLGKGNHSLKLMGMAGSGGYYAVGYDYGVTENLDLGMKIESLSLGYHGKYSFYNNPTGFSSAAAIGYGSTFGGSYYTADITGSYLVNKWEPFTSLRYTSVNSDSKELRDASTGQVFSTIPEFDFSYMQIFVGTKYRFVDWFALSVEAASFLSSSDVSFGSDIYYSISTEFTF
ncbi:MAG: hypothetical protein HOO06_03715 [Bdellovibrionaceae bacterium]|jgi:hypothetical protein|nr:hypothetical protein [Pseudobdellovibrionaceae bacterium]